MRKYGTYGPQKFLKIRVLKFNYFHLPIEKITPNWNHELIFMPKLFCIKKIKNYVNFQKIISSKAWNHVVWYKDESEDECCWKLHLISSGSWKFISIKIWNAPSTIVFVLVEMFRKFFSVVNVLKLHSLLSNQNKNNCGAGISNFDINEFSWTAGNQM